MTEAEFRSHVNRLLRQARCRARRKGHILCDLSYDEVLAQYKLQKGLCQLSLIPMVFGPRAKDNPDSLSIDQIKAGEGYTQNNIQLLTRSVNNAKSTLPTRDFIRMCDRVSAVAARVGLRAPASNQASPPHSSSS